MTAARKLILRPIRAETRRVAAMTAWVRRARPPGDAFGYHRDLHLILWTAGMLTVVEGALTHLILVLIFGHPPWVWIVLGLHIYGVYLLFGLLAGMMTRPHTVDGPIVHLRNASGTHVSFAVADVDSVVLGERPEFGHSRWRTSDDAERPRSLPGRQYFASTSSRMPASSSTQPDSAGPEAYSCQCRCPAGVRRASHHSIVAAARRRTMRAGTGRAPITLTDVVRRTQSARNSVLVPGQMRSRRRDHMTSASTAARARSKLTADAKLRSLSSVAMASFTRELIGRYPAAVIGSGPPLVVLTGLTPSTGITGDGFVRGSCAPLREVTGRQLIVINRRPGLRRR